MTVVLCGLALRAALIVGAPRFGYPWDHFDVIGMGIVAEERGITRVYSIRKEQLPVLRGVVFFDGRPVTIDRRCVNPPNYPPLCEVALWLQAAWLRAAVVPLVVNTVTTRTVTSVVPILAELLVAVAVGLLVRRVAPDRPRLAVTAAATTWLAPPLMMNTALWSQYDALPLAAFVFAVVALLDGRPVRAGLCVAAALLLKPQGLLLAPIVAFGVLVAAPGERGARAVTRRLLTIAAVAGIAVVTISSPWMLADGLAWVERCYRRSLVDVFPYTTLEAYNVWYLYALIAERAPAFDVLAPTTPLAGMSRDAWGKLALLIALAATALLCWRRRRRDPAVALVLFAGMWLWSTFIWPTRVHERYIVYCLPFMIAAAAALPRLRPVVLALLVVATLEHSWNVWRTGPPVGSLDRAAVTRFHQQSVLAFWKGRQVTRENAVGAPTMESSTAAYHLRYREERRRSATVEWLVTIVSLAAYGAAVLLVAFDRGEPRTSP